MFFLFKYFSDREHDYLIKLKSHPIKYTYFVKNSIAHRSLASSDMECLEKIKNYYLNLDGSTKQFVPSCSDLSVPVNDPVYILSGRVNDEYVKIAYIHIRKNGSEKVYVGYLWRNTIVDKPFKSHEFGISELLRKLVRQHEPHVEITSTNSALALKEMYLNP
jgi:hypothetical protein